MLKSPVDLARLSDYQQRGLLRSQRHPTRDLTIWNYGPSVQWERQWDEVTLQCRGLVTNDEGWIIARPFPKFFNLGEHEALIGPLPDEPFTVSEKMDGSLILLFRYQEQPVVASRGSWISEQAVRARAILTEKYAEAIHRLPNDETYLFEIIYPENRIVVDYGDREELILLAVFETETGVELSATDRGVPVVRQIEHAGGFRDLPAYPQEEGYVIRFESGVRVKLKNEEYLRLHRLLTQTTPKAIWEAMRDGVPLTDFIERVPDEFNQWVRRIVEDLENRVSALEQEAVAIANTLDPTQSRKDLARIITRAPVHLQPIIWMALDDKDPRPYIWKQVKPTATDHPFRQDEEETND